MDDNELDQLRHDTRKINRNLRVLRLRLKRMQQCLHVIEKSTKPIMGLWDDYNSARSFLTKMWPAIKWIVRAVVVSAVLVVFLSNTPDIDWQKVWSLIQGYING